MLLSFFQSVHQQIQKYHHFITSASTSHSTILKCNKNPSTNNSARKMFAFKFHKKKNNKIVHLNTHRIASLLLRQHDPKKPEIHWISKIWIPIYKMCCMQCLQHRMENILFIHFLYKFIILGSLRRARVLFFFCSLCLFFLLLLFCSCLMRLSRGPQAVVLELIHLFTLLILWWCFGSFRALSAYFVIYEWWRDTIVD